MRARLVAFGLIEVDGHRYDHDVVIRAGVVTKRRKGPSKALRGHYGHTPLSTQEDIPWGGRLLVIGTGASGALPVAPQVAEEAARRGVRLVAVPTREACDLLADMPARDVHAVLHVTC